VQAMKNKNVMFGALLALLALVLFYRVVYGSMQSQASKAKKSQQNYETQISALQHQLKLIAPGANGGPTKGVSKDELAAAVPPAANEAEFLRIFQQIGDASGVKFSQVTPSNPNGTSGSSSSSSASSAAAGVQTINVGITVQGTYNEVQDYVNRLMHAPRLLVIDSENVTTGPSSSGTQTGGGPVGPVFAGQGQAPTLQVQLTARIFTLAAPSVATGRTATSPTTVVQAAQNS
jgi:hypothetical protein